MRGYIVDSLGNEYMLPMLFYWRVCHTDGRKCDSFEVSFQYSDEGAKLIKKAVRFYGLYEGKRVFYGVIDEFELDYSGSYTIKVWGRGLGALLMDNEAPAAEFSRCTVSDILERYVKSVGITKIAQGDFPYVTGLCVTSGESCFSVLSRFCEISAGITPRFSRDGTLILKKSGEERLIITNSDPVSDVVYREKRYGRISQATVKTVRGASVTEKDGEFISLGGSAGRINLVPKNTSRADMARKAREIIEKSKKGKKMLEITLPSLFAAEPGNKASVYLTKIGAGGDYIISETEVWADENSCGAKLYLESEE